MASNERIDSIIDEKAFQQLEKAVSLLVNTQGELVKATQEAKKFNEAIGNSKSVGEYAKAQDDAERANLKLQKQLEKTRLEEIKLQKAREKAFDDYDKKIQKQIDAANRREKIAEINHKREIQRAKTEEKQAAANSKRITEQSRVYVQLSATLETLRKDAQDIGAVFGTNSFQFQKAAEKVNLLDQRLKDIDKQLGKSQRFVGEYERAGTRSFDGLGNSVQQLTREFPAFTFSIQTGFLALSNNIPIFFDQIRQTQKEIATLRAEGQKVPGLFSQLAKSIFSWGTALSIGITLLTIYGKEIGEFLGSLFKGTEALDDFTKAQNERNRAQKAYNDTLREGSKDAQKELVDLDVTRKAIENKNISMNQRNKLVDDLQEKYPAYFANLTNEEILAGNVGNAYKNLKSEILATAQARAAQDKIAENAAKQLDNEGKIIEARKQQLKLDKDLAKARASEQSATDMRETSIDAEGNAGRLIASGIKQNKIQNKIAEQQKIINDAFSENNQLAADNARLIGKINDAVEKTDARGLTSGLKSDDTSKIITSDLELLKFRQFVIQQTNKAILDDDTKSAIDRLSALEKFTTSSQEIARLDSKIQLRDKDLDKNEKLLIEEELKNQTSNIALETAALRLKIEQDAIDRADKKRIEANQKELTQLEIQRDTALLNLDESFLRGELSQKEYESEKLKIQKEFAQLAIQEQINQVQEEINVQKARGKDTTNLEAELAALRIKYSKEATDAQIKDLEKVAEAEKKLKELQKELGNELFELGVTFANAQFEREQQKIDKQIEDSEIQADFERKRVEESLLSEEEKAIKLAQIDATAQAKREALERRQRQLAIQQARFAKAADAARIVSQTALAVVSALTPPPVGLGPVLGVPVAIATGALGAVQLAQVLATPIPGFYKGTDNSPEGLAYVGEQGAEGRINPDGTFSITPPKKTLTYLEKGTQIIPAPELRQIIAAPTNKNFAGAEKISMTEVVNAINKSTNETKKAIKNINIPPSTMITKSGWIATQRKNNGWNKYLNDNLN